MSPSKQRFLNQKALSEKWADIASSEVFERACEATLLAFAEMQNDAFEPTLCNALYHRMAGARLALKLLASISTPTSSLSHSPEPGRLDYTAR